MIYFFKGIGNAVARRLSGEGLSVFAGCLNQDGPEASKLKSEYSNIQIVQIDITDDNSVNKAFDVIEKKVKDKGLSFIMYPISLVIYTFFF